MNAYNFGSICLTVFATPFKVVLTFSVKLGKFIFPGPIQDTRISCIGASLSSINPLIIFALLWIHFVHDLQSLKTVKRYQFEYFFISTINQLSIFIITFVTVLHSCYIVPKCYENWSFFKQPAVQFRG